jgi:hypothetical protein
VIWPIVHLVVIVVLSLLATVVLFKWLRSQAFVQRKEAGLKVVLTGGAAAAAVFGVLLFMADKYLTTVYKPAEQTWEIRHIRGVYRLSDGSTDRSGMSFPVEPPDQSVGDNGAFEVQGIYFPTDRSPAIFVSKIGYETRKILLSEDKLIPEPNCSNTYRLRDTILLASLPDAAGPGGEDEPYDPQAAATAVPGGQ